MIVRPYILHYSTSNAKCVVSDWKTDVLVGVGDRFERNEDERQNSIVNITNIT